MPIFSLAATPWISYLRSSNIVEKILVNAFFPGGAGGIAGEIYYLKCARSRISFRSKKYLARLSGTFFGDCLVADSVFRRHIGSNSSWAATSFDIPSAFHLTFYCFPFDFYPDHNLLPQKQELGRLLPGEALKAALS